MDRQNGMIPRCVCLAQPRVNQTCGWPPIHKDPATSLTPCSLSYEAMCSSGHCFSCQSRISYKGTNKLVSCHSLSMRVCFILCCQAWVNICRRAPSKGNCIFTINIYSKDNKMLLNYCCINQTAMSRIHAINFGDLALKLNTVATALCQLISDRP